MRRRLDLASALVHTPQVLFLDEPTTGLDPVSRKAIWEEVRKLNDEGTTVFLTTQYLEEADQLADRVGIISRRPCWSPRAPRPRSRPRSASPHLELSLVDQGGEEAEAEEVLARFGRPLPARDGKLLVELEQRRLRGRRRSSARSTRPGSTSSRSTWSSPPSTTSSSHKTGQHLEGDEEDTDETEAVAGDRPSGGERPRGRRARRALGQADASRRPQLLAPLIVFPTAAARDPDRRRGAGGRPARLPAGRQTSSPSCSPGRWSSRCCSPATPGRSRSRSTSRWASPTGCSRRRSRASRSCSGGSPATATLGRVHRDLVHRDRPDLRRRRSTRGCRRRSGSSSCVRPRRSPSARSARRSRCAPAVPAWSRGCSRWSS